MLSADGSVEPRVPCPSCGNPWPLDRWSLALPEPFEFMVVDCDVPRCVTFCHLSCSDKMWCPTETRWKAWVRDNDPEWQSFLAYVESRQRIEIVEVVD